MHQPFLVCFLFVRDSTGTRGGECKHEEDISPDLKEYLVECGRGNTEIPEGGHLVDGGDPTAEV